MTGAELGRQLQRYLKYLKRSKHLIRIAVRHPPPDQLRLQPLIHDLPIGDQPKPPLYVRG